MESSEAKPFDSFKSKKALCSNGKPALSDEAPDRSPWSSKTPEKLINPPRRVLNRRTAMSVKEIRQAAEMLRTSGRVPVNKSDPIISEFPIETPTVKSRSKELPEKYEILDKFFNSLDSSIRLLRLKGSMSTFTNISPKIECLTHRRFSYSHLAQIKFILPEALEIKKILTLDERTSCMNPDLHVTLNANAIENDGILKSDSGSLQLRKVFRARLINFCKANPEGDEVPEEELPEPFNRSNQASPANMMKDPNLQLMHEKATDAPPEQQPMAASHLSRSFRRHFSKEVASNAAVKISQEPSGVPLQTKTISVSETSFDQSSTKEGACASTALSPIKWSSKVTIGKKDIASGASVANSLSVLPATSIKNFDSEKNEGLSSMGTPAKLISTPAKLMSATPAQQPPKRCFMSPDDDSVKLPNKLVRRPNCSRSLKFGTLVKNEISSSER